MITPTPAIRNKGICSEKITAEATVTKAIPIATNGYAKLNSTLDNVDTHKTAPIPIIIKASHNQGFITACTNEDKILPETNCNFVACDFINNSAIVTHNTEQTILTKPFFIRRTLKRYV